MVAVPLEAIDEAVLRDIHRVSAVTDSYAAFRAALLRGDALKRYRAAELRVIAKELSKLYQERFSITLSACKADLIRQIEFFRESSLAKNKIEMPPRPAPAATPAPRAPAVPPTRPVQEQDALPTLLRTLPFPAQQPASPVLRWVGLEAMARQPPRTRLRQQLQVSLSPEEHTLLSDRRKRSTALHLLCLTPKLAPSAWPQSAVVKVEGRAVELPFGAWHAKDSSRDWCRVVSPADLTHYINPFSRTLWITVEVGPCEEEGHVFAVCVAASKGVRAVFEDTRAALLRAHRLKTGEDLLERPAPPQRLEGSVDTAPPCENGGAAAGAPDAASPPPAPRARLTQGGDEDVLVSKTTVPLLDPVTLRRVDTPVKAAACTHPATFDLYTFIEFCSASRVWVCPECEAPARIEDLRIDPLFHSILRADAVKGDRNVTHVHLHSDGSWEPKYPENQEPQRPQAAKRSADDADIVLIDDSDGGGSDDSDATTVDDAMPGIGAQRPARAKRRRVMRAAPVAMTPQSEAPSVEIVGEQGSVEHPIEL